MNIAAYPRLFAAGSSSESASSFLRGFGGLRRAGGFFKRRAGFGGLPSRRRLPHILRLPYMGGGRIFAASAFGGRLRRLRVFPSGGFSRHNTQKAAGGFLRASLRAEGGKEGRREGGKRAGFGLRLNFHCTRLIGYAYNSMNKHTSQALGICYTFGGSFYGQK